MRGSASWGVIFEAVQDYSNTLTSFEKAVEKSETISAKATNIIRAAHCSYIWGCRRNFGATIIFVTKI
jgi:hypothetical protein